MYKLPYKKALLTLVCLSIFPLFGANADIKMPSDWHGKRLKAHHKVPMAAVKHQIYRVLPINIWMFLTPRSPMRKKWISSYPNNGN
ncbi:alpha/beta hydrolase [Yersinia enterocolitica]|nr:alpha/beta hydrolase [Yersinia enterocolitica]